MVQAKFPISFWGDALMTTAYILNRVSSKSLPSTPYGLWKGEKSYLNIMRPWGCAAYVHNMSHEYGMLGPRGEEVYLHKILRVHQRICLLRGRNKWKCNGN